MKAPEPATLDQFTVVERAIIYARVSTDEQAESGTSIDNQVEKSLAYAEANNIQVVATFREDYTGRVLDRPELNRAREMLRAGLADNLIVYKTNRLDRSEWGINLLILLQELKTLGIGLHYSQDRRRVDLTNPIEALMQSISGWQAGEDYSETVRKLREGRFSRARSGYVVAHGSPPYGYRLVKGENKRWYFEIDESEAATVRMIFTWYVIGDETGKTLSLVKIADKLNSMGIPASKGGKWGHGRINFILANETYAGTWHYGKRGSGGKRRPISEAVPVPVPAIVDRELWELAQLQLQKNKAQSQRNRKPGRYLLTSWLTCGDCGYKMFGTTKTTRGVAYSYYVCGNRHIPRLRGHECHSPCFYSEITDAKVWTWLEEIATNKDKLLAGLQGYQSRQESEIGPIKRELTYVEQLLTEKTAELEDDLLNMKFLTSDRARAKKAADIAQVEATLNELEAKKAGLLAEIEEKSVTDEQITGIFVFASQVAADLETLRKAEAQGRDLPELRIAVYEAKRKLLAMLNIQVILFVEDGKRKARVTAKMCPDGEVLSVDAGNVRNAKPGRQWMTIEAIIDLE